MEIFSILIYIVGSRGMIGASPYSRDDRIEA